MVIVFANVIPVLAGLRSRNSGRSEVQPTNERSAAAGTNRREPFIWAEGAALTGVKLAPSVLTTGAVSVRKANSVLVCAVFWP